MTLKTADAMVFPAVTLCNFQQVHCGNLFNHIQNCSANQDSCSVDRLVFLCQIQGIANCSDIKAYADSVITGTYIPPDNSVCAPFGALDTSFIESYLPQEIAPEEYLIAKCWITCQMRTEEPSDTAPRA